jgi:hypothetical protein
MFKRKFRVEILINGKPILPTRTEFPTRDVAETYAMKLCAKLDSITSYRIFESGWGARPRTANSPEWIASPNYVGAIRST